MEVGPLLRNNQLNIPYLVKNPRELLEIKVLCFNKGKQKLRKKCIYNEGVSVCLRGV